MYKSLIRKRDENGHKRDIEITYVCMFLFNIKE
jgi:hypothetical protein